VLTGAKADIFTACVLRFEVVFMVGMSVVPTYIFLKKKEASHSETIKTF